MILLPPFTPKGTTKKTEVTNVLREGRPEQFSARFLTFEIVVDRPGQIPGGADSFPLRIRVVLQNGAQAPERHLHSSARLSGPTQDQSQTLGS
jgi:hypothetical protein